MAEAPPPPPGGAASKAAPNKVRSFLNKNSSLITILAVVILILSLVRIIQIGSGGSAGPRVVDVYFYDLNTGELFTAKSDQYPPIQAPSGERQTLPDGQAAPAGLPAGVRAYVFACGECSDPDQRFIGWLEMYTPETKDMMENPEKYEPEDPAAMDYEMMEAWEQGHLVRRVEDTEWVSANSEEGYMIMQDMQDRCGEEQVPEPCMP